MTERVKSVTDLINSAADLAKSVMDLIASTTDLIKTVVHLIPFPWERQASGLPSCHPVKDLIAVVTDRLKSRWSPTRSLAGGRLGKAAPNGAGMRLG
jgi:hypothetical protein